MDYFLKQINVAKDATPLRIFLEKNEIVIGRSSSTSLTGFNKVSRKHAKFLNKNGRWFVCDLESLNKLYVNFKEVGNELTPIEIGDIIGFGTSSYTEDGALVCVFAVKHRIKQEITDTIECSGFKENSENIQNFSSVKGDKPLEVRQELLSGKEGCLSKTLVRKPEYIIQTDVSRKIANTTNVNYIHQSNVLKFQHKLDANSEYLKPVVKTEPIELDDAENLEIKSLSNENLLVNEKREIVNTFTCDNLDTNFALQNKIDDEVHPQCKDAEYFEESNEKSDYISKNKTLGSFERLEGRKNDDCPKTKISKTEKNSSAKLLKCDSDHSQLSSDINDPKRFVNKEKRSHFLEPIVPNKLQNAKKTDLISTEKSEERNFKSDCKKKKTFFGSQKRENPAKLSLKLTIKKNRIISSSSERSSDESEFEKKHSKISSNGALGKGCLRTKSNKKTGDKQSLRMSRRNNGSSNKTFPALKVSEKRKQDSSENSLKKSRSSKTEFENQSNFNESPYMNVGFPDSASVNETDIRNRKILKYSKDESAFCVDSSGCSKYWTPDYNEFETGEIHEGLKSKFDKKRQTAGRILLTDPKPMEYRPRKMRGREEGFQEQTSYSYRGSEQSVNVPENVKETPKAPEKLLKLSSTPRCASSKEHSFVVNGKFSTKSYSNTSIVLSKENTKKRATEPTPRETLQSPGGKFAIAARKNADELFSSIALPESKGSFLNTALKNCKEIFSSETLLELGGKSSTAGQKNPLMHFSRGTLAASSENFKFFQRNSIELISSESATLRENSQMENQEESIQDTSDNSTLTAVTIRRNNVRSVPRTSSGCSRFLLEEQKNTDDTLKNNGQTTKETFPQCLEKANKTKEINVSTVPTVEKTNEEKKNKNNALSSISPDQRNVSIPKTFSTSRFENNKHIIRKTQENTEENELCTNRGSDTSEIESNRTETKKMDPEYLPRELITKNDKSSDKKIAVVTPNKKRYQSDTFSVLDHNPVKKTSKNIERSSCILSPVKTCSEVMQANSDSISIADASEDSKHAKLSSRYLIKCIVQWNPKWLEEQAKNKKPPPVVSKGGSALPLRFSSYETYVKSFRPMISLEIWESLFRESKTFWLKKEVKNGFYFKVISNNLKHSLIELQCESFANENLSFVPSEGNVILLGFNEFGNGLENSLLGYIHQHKIERARKIEKTKEFKNVPEEDQVNTKLWTFSLYIKKSNRNFSIGSVNLAYGILNIKNKLQLADALGRFKDSPIQNDILQPTKDMFSFSNSISKIPQQQLIQAVSEEIKNEKPHSKLILINAAVATGKTSAIIGIVEKLLFSNTARVKLLLCALSDFTVNEMGLRLIELNERCSWRGNAIKFVRFGESENIPAKLQSYTLESKVLKVIKEQHWQEFQDREKELKVLEDKINDLLFKDQSQNNNKNLLRESYDVALKHLTDQLQYLKENSPSKSIDPVIQTKHENAILSESDVVLTTLHNCMHPQIRKFLKSCNEKSQACCIVDEISQCTELEVLQCLHPEIKRLVLVGDLQQLQPSVSSKYAIQWGYKRSMMERILKLFSVQFQCPTPPLSLAEQHRMHSQICHFPSKYFYKDQLLTAEDVDDKYKNSPFKPFLVYDILEKEMPTSSVKLEHSEPFIIATICAQILQAVPKASLGVIVVCEDLAAIYKIPLSQASAELREIEVNTVENFQGIEKDVIIISCINPSLFAEHENFLSSEHKMNVAITRARQSLIICGHVSSLTQFKHWNALVDDAKERKNFISVSSLRQIPFVTMKSICRMG